MSYNNNFGCLGQLIALGVIAIILSFVDLYNDSERGMINRARDGKYEFYYEDYLSKYPKGKYANEAVDSIYSILSRGSDQRKIIDYAHKHPGTSLSDKLAHAAYENGLIKRDVSYWEYYINNIDNNQLKADAEQQLALLHEELKREEKKKWGTESLAWQTVQEQKSYEAYQKYINLYPRGKHKKEAQKVLIDMEVAKDFAGQHGRMPDLERTTSGTGKYSSVYIENRTSYVLTVLYSGSHSDKLSIPPRSHGRIRLLNGSYRISAKVDASNVIPYVGTTTLSGGEYSSSFYISTTRY